MKLTATITSFGKMNEKGMIIDQDTKVTYPEKVPIRAEDGTIIGECHVERREDGLYGVIDQVPQQICESIKSKFNFSNPQSHYSKIKTCCIENGPGVRTSVFFSGCRRHCPGCHNQEAWYFEHGKDFNWNTIQDILKTIEPEWVSGLSILGGEPLEPENLYWVTRLIAAFREKFGPEKTIWLYTGYTYEDILLNLSWDVYHVITSVDVLVDGPYLEAEKDAGLAYRGSRNQRMIDIPKTKNSYEIVLWEWDA